MADPHSQTVVLTTSAPGVAWFALVTAGIEAARAAIVTRPGVAIDIGDPSLARELCSALALTGANQLAVIGYAEDTVYQLGARGLANLTRKQGGDAGRFGGDHAVLPGLKRDAAATVQRSVRKLAKAGWLPPGMVVLGVVVSRNGTSDNVALEVVGEAGREAPPEPEPEPRRNTDDLEPHPLETPPPTPVPEPAAAPWPDDSISLETPFAEFGDAAPPEAAPAPGIDALQGDTPASLSASGPVSMGAPAMQGPTALGRSGGGGPIGLGGQVSSGPSALGEMTESGPTGLGGSALGGSTLGDRVLGGSSLGGASLGGSSLGETRDGDGSLGALGTGGALGSDAVPAPSSPPDDDPDDAFDRWFHEDRGRTIDQMDAPPADPDSGDIDARLAASARLLHEFLRSQKFQPPIDQDTRKLLHDGASPEVIMRQLKILVAEFGRERSDVRAAFGTLEMAQTLLTRDDLTTVLRRILR